MPGSLKIWVALVVLGFGTPLHGQTQKRLWLLQRPNTIVEYDPETFRIKQTIQVPDSVPDEVVRGAEDSTPALSLSNDGKILFVPGVNTSQWGKLWLWNGTTGVWLDRRSVTGNAPAKGSGNGSAADSFPTPYLSKDSKHLFWFSNTPRAHGMKEPAGNEVLTSETTFRAWQSDLQGNNQEVISTISLPPCKCETGFCEETCPTLSWYVPKEGLDDFFLLTHFIAGQVKSDYQWSSLYQKTAGKWQHKKLPQPLEGILDATDGGAMVIETNGDGAILLDKDGQRTVLFDQFKRFNLTYDLMQMNLYPGTAEISPDRNSIAWDICLGGNAAAEVGTWIGSCPEVTKEIEIPLDAGQKPTAAELSVIRKALRDLPTVEVLGPQTPEKNIVRLPHATLVGWLNSKEVMVLQNTEITVLDITTGAVKKSGIHAEKREYVFLR